ncbi:Uroporphyrinogen decarboxylase [Thalictrum thalictroides]|uniref:Uroporphyrinogen decarboxylase n=1 Tax=Thalictrum thalictroides TaxID=46969 RepID=A0A7J6W8L2_THATH|nr:Uroporphyrinogen decarboxylase [Thalictrum thalictroides]
MAKYIKYKADSGAQDVQIFYSCATELSPVDFEEFSFLYLKQIVDSVKKTHPNLPFILYASRSGGLLERLRLTGVDVVSLDWTVQKVGDDYDLMWLSKIITFACSSIRTAYICGEKSGVILEIHLKMGEALKFKFGLDIQQEKMHLTEALNELKSLNATEAEKKTCHEGVGHEKFKQLNLNAYAT